MTFNWLLLQFSNLIFEPWANEKFEVDLVKMHLDDEVSTCIKIYFCILDESAKTKIHLHTHRDLICTVGLDDRGCKKVQIIIFFSNSDHEVICPCYLGLRPTSSQMSTFNFQHFGHQQQKNSSTGCLVEIPVVQLKFYWTSSRTDDLDFGPLCISYLIQFYHQKQKTCCHHLFLIVAFMVKNLIIKDQSKTTRN